MNFLIWLIYVILDVLFTLVCYITNPIVVLFADQKGNLPNIFKWWQTYDNTLDVEWMITEKVVPKIFRYDYKKHYLYIAEYKKVYPCVPGYVVVLDPNFTWKELVQRYFCRLWWLYRNTGYGFSYYVCGKEYNPKKLETPINLQTDKYNTKVLYYYQTEHIKLWRVYYTKIWLWKFYIRIYLGWKLNKSDMDLDRAMIACFIHPFRIAD